MSQHSESNDTPAHETTTSSLTRRRLLKGAAVAGAASLLPVRAFALNSQPLPGGGTNSSPTLDISNTVVGSIPDRFFGLSYEKLQASTNTFFGSNSTLINLLNLLGPGVLRFGGATVDKEIWDKNGPGGKGSQGVPMPANTVSLVDVNNVNDVLNATNYQCIWGINLVGHTWGTTPTPTTQNTTPALATDEAAIARDVFGTKLIGIELGNEPDGYHITQAAFASTWKTFRDAIVQRSPSMPIYAPVTAGYAWADWFMQSSGYAPLIKGLSSHYYRMSSGTAAATVDNLIAPEPDTLLATYLSHLQADVSGLNIPFRLAECNSVSSGNANAGNAALNPANKYASALWVIDYLFQVAASGCAGVNFHSGGSDSSYTPFVLNNGGVINDIRPMFYGLLMFQMMGTGNLLQSAYTGRPNCRAYVVQKPTGGMKVMIVNTDDTYNMHMTINCPSSVSAAVLTEMTQSPDIYDTTMSDISATSGVTINRGTVSSVTGVYTPGHAPYDLSLYPGNVVKCYVPRRTACIVDISS